jgi:phosphate transport system substrate-binding protein
MTTHRRAASRWATVAAALLVGTFGLAACGSDPVPTSSAGAATTADLSCPGGTLTGEGSSAQGNAISEVIANYNAECGDTATIEYNPTGSGAGIKSFYNGLVDFAGSDSALKSESSDGVVETDKAEERCQGNPAWNLPMVVGPIAFSYNVEGVDGLVLTPQVLAGIYNGTIKTWNSPKIAALNEGVSLPAEPITVFFRSDESGTTENVTKFLKAASDGVWKKEPSKAWTGVGEGKNKSSGVADGVSSTPNSISYMEWSYARDNNLQIAQVDNGSGAVELTAETVAKAVTEAEIKGSGNDLSLQVKYADTAAGAYPALLVTYEIVCSQGLAAEKTELLKDFLTYFASEGTQGGLEELGYAPLPEELRSKVETSVQAIK